jgi:hypothetical protein
MLYVNNVELKPESPEWKRYQKFLDEVIPELSETVVFKRNTPIRVNHTGLVEPDPLMFVPYEARVYDETFGSQHWRYCESAPTQNSTGKWTYRPLGKNFKRTESVSKKERPDYIFFMLELCHRVRNKDIICEDREQEALKTIERDDKQVAVKYMIYNSLSPLSPENTGSEELLRMIGAAWGVPHAHGKRRSLAEVRVELFDIVNKNEEKHDISGRGFDTFLSEIKSKERIILRANIQRAVDSKAIRYDPKEFTWKYVAGSHIITVLSTRFFDNPANGLFDYFLRDENKRRIFYGTLENKYEEAPEEVMEEPEPSEEVVNETATEDKKNEVDIESLGWKELQKMAKGMNLRYTWVSKPDLIENIKGKIAADKHLQETE